jgi:hypothetical protein
MDPFDWSVLSFFGSGKNQECFHKVTDWYTHHRPFSSNFSIGPTHFILFGQTSTKLKIEERVNQPLELKCEAAFNLYMTSVCLLSIKVNGSNMWYLRQ